MTFREVSRYILKLHAHNWGLVNIFFTEMSYSTKIS